ncbi:YciI family protein [Erythrobacter sp. YT30]|uniref:YciI family protein n=1 Tax=Erythrobacter sp. YT30 TaxID=1735012 RepID=UPI00076BE783|nr:YciI family protein [Erythrobacter sp. YT30]KWV93140.1 hypothetical protein AUC45_03185 [Erythrobacter sp. YT30]
MKYTLMIHENEAIYQGDDGGKLMEEVVGKHMALIEDMVAAGVYEGGNRLQGADSATTIKYQSGKGTLHDGPFIETHEELGGYYVIDVGDLDAAIEWARKIPVPGDGAIEIRPNFEM